MPVYKVTDPTTGKNLKITGDSPPTEQELEQIFSTINNNVSRETVAPTKNMSITEALSTSKPINTGDLVIDSLMTAQKEVVGPLVQGFNQMGLGLPKLAIRKVLGEDAAKEIFPEQSTSIGKVGRFLGEAGGIAIGLPGQISRRVAAKIIPKVGAKLNQKVIGRTLEGATVGALTSPKEFEDINQRKINTLLGGGLGAAAGASSLIPATGKKIQDVIFGKKIAEYARTNSWGRLLDKTDIGDTVPNTIKRKLTNFFPNARKNVGEKINGLINGKYKDIHQPLTPLKSDINDFVLSRPLDQLDVTPVEAKRLTEITNRIFSLGNVSATSKKAPSDFVRVGDLWKLRKELDDYVRQFPLKSDEAVGYWRNIRSKLNQPIKSLGKDVEKRFKDFEFVSDAQDELGRTFEGIVDKNTGQIYSQKINNFLEGLFSKNKEETVNLLRNTEKFLKLDDSVLDDALDFAVRREVQSSSGGVSRSGIVQDFLKEPLIRTSDAIQKGQRIIPRINQKIKTIIKRKNP